MDADFQNFCFRMVAIQFSAKIQYVQIKIRETLLSHTNIFTIPAIFVINSVLGTVE